MPIHRYYRESTPALRAATGDHGIGHNDINYTFTTYYLNNCRHLPTMHLLAASLYPLEHFLFLYPVHLWQATG
jgi:hypothetical protein